MNPNEVIAELVQTHGGLCVLDKLHLPYDRESSGPAAKFGLGCVLYFAESDLSVSREKVREFLISYQATFSTYVNEFLPRDARRTVRIRQDLASRLDAEYERFQPETGYSAALFGAVDIGLPKDDVEPYQANVLSRRAGDKKLSFVSACTPVCGERDQVYAETLLDQVLQWSTICKPKHGSGGFSFIFASGMSQNTKYALHMMKRFPGFDIIDGVGFVVEAGAVHDRIKCVNWLTVLGDEIVGTLGGVEPMRKALEPVCKVHEYAGGVVIQAGEAPQLGDTYTNDTPEAYRMVARYTKAVRFEDYRSGLFRVNEGLDKKAETLSWVRRFD